MYTVHKKGIPKSIYGGLRDNECDRVKKTLFLGTIFLIEVVNMMPQQFLSLRNLLTITGWDLTRTSSSVASYII